MQDFGYWLELSLIVTNSDFWYNSDKQEAKTKLKLYTVWQKWLEYFVFNELVDYWIFKHCICFFLFFFLKNLMRTRSLARNFANEAETKQKI